LTAGIYTAQATNPNGCQSNLISVTITEPSNITANSVLVQPLCNGQSNGSIITNFSGGTGNLNYNWNIGTSNANLSNIGSGIYTVQVTDQNGCSTSSSYILIDPTAITVTNTITNVNCPGENSGAISTNAQGGTGQLNYSWSTGQTSSNISNLNGGTYTLIVSDANQCTTSEVFNVTEPQVIEDNETIVNETNQGASNGSITTNVNGGTEPYTYAWSNGGTAASISNLTGGVYILNVTDNAGCVKSFTYNVQSGGCALNVSSTITNVLCNGENTGSVAFDITNGTGPYTVTPNPNNLAAGTYNFTVSDNAGCTFQINNVIITQPAALTSVLDSTKNATGPTVADGKIFVSISGGNAPYSYTWKDTLGNIVSIIEDPSNLPPGKYNLTAFDNFQCEIPVITAVVSFISKVDNYLNEAIKVFPNPTSDLISIECESELTVSLFANDGKMIFRRAIEKGLNRVDLTDMKEGSYLLKLQKGNDYITKTIVKIK
jgi:hypothetical protein